jgi:hypothetical protein
LGKIDGDGKITIVPQARARIPGGRNAATELGHAYVNDFDPEKNP